MDIPKYVTQGKTCRGLSKELKTFEDLDLKVVLAANSDCEHFPLTDAVIHKEYVELVSKDQSESSYTICQLLEFLSSCNPNHYVNISPSSGYINMPISLIGKDMGKCMLFNMLVNYLE